MHDLLLTVGFFSITQLEFNTTSIAAILTIVGYSLNETVVVLDRIREMMRKYKRMPTAELIDMSVNAVHAAHDHDGLDGASRAAVARGLRRPGDPLVLAGDDVGHFRRAPIPSIFICSPMLIYLGLRNESREPRARKTARMRRRAKPSRRR